MCPDPLLLGLHSRGISGVFPGRQMFSVLPPSSQSQQGLRDGNDSGSAAEKLILCKGEGEGDGL